MSFKKVLSGKKIVILAIMLALLSGFGLDIYSKNPEWISDNVPEKWRFKLKVSNPNSSKETVEISGYFFTKDVLEKGFDTNWENLGKTTRNNFQKITERYGSSADTLAIEILQTSDKSFPFELKKFALTQGTDQYGWDSHFNIAPLNSTLQIATYWGSMRREHFLRPGVEALGFISLPDGIDLSKPFTIWYGSYSAELNAEGLDIKQ